MFVDRQPELTFLNSILERKRPTPAQFILLYGRRRVGKTVLLRHWAEGIDVPTIVMAGSGDYEETELKQFSNVVAFMPKPFELKHMVASVKRYARG